MKYSFLVTPKITPHVNNYLWFLLAVQDLGDSLHVRHNFLWLIIASTKFIFF